MLKKADPQRRAAFVQYLQDLFARLCRKEIRLLDLDEAHLHRDMDLGYTWAPEGKPARRASGCGSLAERINWHGAYDFFAGQCFINPIEGLWKRMREEVTRTFCHASMRHPLDACKAFIDRINGDPLRLVSRLWPRFELDPEFEKFLVSK